MHDLHFCTFLHFMKFDNRGNFHSGDQVRKIKLVSVESPKELDMSDRKQTT